MKIERDYVLKRLDEWYVSLIKNRYTPEVFEELKKRISGRLSKKSLEMIMESGGFEMLSVDNTIEDYREFFSFNIENLEKCLNEDIDDYPEEIASVCRESMNRTYKDFIRLVDNLREKSDDIFPGELTDQDLKDIYTKTYEGVNNIVNLMTQSFQSTLIALEKVYKKNEIDIDSYLCSKEYIKALIDETPWFYSIFFE